MIKIFRISVVFSVVFFFAYGSIFSLLYNDLQKECVVTPVEVFLEGQSEQKYIFTYHPIYSGSQVIIIEFKNTDFEIDNSKIFDAKIVDRKLIHCVVTDQNGDVQSGPIDLNYETVFFAGSYREKSDWNSFWMITAFEAKSENSYIIRFSCSGFKQTSTANYHPRLVVTGTQVALSIVRGNSFTYMMENYLLGSLCIVVFTLSFLKTGARRKNRFQSSFIHRR